MALSLDCNASYNLINKSEDSGNKEIIFVKLTDSCVKAIEEYLKHKAATNSNPSIYFDGSNGQIAIPSKRSGSSDNVLKRFNFSSAPLVQTNERHGVLECLQQPLQGSNTLLSIGKMQKKISVMGTEDAYEMTRTRMAQVDKEKKEVRTKEIRINHMKKGVKKPHVIPPVNSQLLSLSNKKKPNVTSSNGSGSSSFESLKDRVLHMLALKPMKKIDILGRLQRDGVNLKDSSQISNVLEQVAGFQDNIFKLHRRFYNELQVDKWPHYNEVERQAVKRNIAGLKRQDASPTVSSTTKSPEERNLHKRMANDSLTSAAKKPRIVPPSEPSQNRHVPVTNPDKEKTDGIVSRPSIKDPPPESKRSPTVPQDKNRWEDGGVRKESPPVVASTSKSPDYLSKYTTINSYEQRCQYKQDFQSGYSEYIELKKNIDAISTKFIELDRSWKRCNKGSSDAARIQEEIYRLYEEHQRDDKYRDMKKRFQELHDKLSHIKQLVVDYDKSTMQEGT